MTYQTPNDAGDAVDPSVDPSGYLTDLLARYFRPGLVDRLIRTWVPVAIGSALAWINTHWAGLGLPTKPSDTAVLISGGVVIAAYYGLASLVERRFPRLGRWLVALNLTKARPTYAQPKVAAQVEAAAARTPGQP